MYYGQMYLNLIDPTVARVVALTITIAISVLAALKQWPNDIKSVESFRLAIARGSDEAIILSRTRSLLPLQIFMININCDALEYQIGCVKHRIVSNTPSHTVSRHLR